MNSLSQILRSNFYHILLFLLTFFTTTLAGVQWLNKDSFELSNFDMGLPYSLSLLAILAAHEFGHFFAARYYGVLTSLPYFIPIPPYLINPFGTMGAVIRIRSKIPSRKALFDIGIAGPIAGFIITMTLLLYGLSTLPEKDYLYSIHPDYRSMVDIPQSGLTLGNSFLFSTLPYLISPNQFLPPMNEIYHYPFLCVGWFGLFVTALNLIPIGQLDGGHILYAMVGGKYHRIFARIFFAALLLMGATSFLPIFGENIYIGTMGWLLLAIILFFIIKIDHPEISDDELLSANRRFLGWTAFIIFFLTFTPIPFSG